MKIVVWTSWSRWNIISLIFLYINYQIYCATCAPLIVCWVYFYSITSFCDQSWCLLLLKVETLIKINKYFHEWIIVFRFNQNLNGISWCIWNFWWDNIRQNLSWISSKPELISEYRLSQRSYGWIPSCQTVRTGCITLDANINGLTNWELSTLKNTSIRTFLLTVNCRVRIISGIHLRAICAYVDIWIWSKGSCDHFKC